MACGPRMRCSPSEPWPKSAGWAAGPLACRAGARVAGAGSRRQPWPLARSPHRAKQELTPSIAPKLFEYLQSTQLGGEG